MRRIFHSASGRDSERLRNYRPARPRARPFNVPCSMFKEKNGLVRVEPRTLQDRSLFDRRPRLVRIKFGHGLGNGGRIFP